jgi:hypothetical protein
MSARQTFSTASQKRHGEPRVSGGRRGEVKEEADALSLLSAGGQEPRRLPGARGGYQAHDSIWSEPT